MKEGLLHMFRTIILQLSLSWKPPLAPKCPYFVPTKLQMHPVFIQASTSHPVLARVDWISFFRKHSEKLKENISNTWLGLIWLWKLPFYEEEKWNSQNRGWPWLLQMSPCYPRVLWRRRWLIITTVSSTFTQVAPLVSRAMMMSIIVWNMVSFSQGGNDDDHDNVEHGQVYRRRPS